MAFSVEKPGSSSDAFTNISNATLMRSGGLFFTSAAARMASRATTRKRSGSRATPTRSRTSWCWDVPVRADPTFRLDILAQVEAAPYVVDHGAGHVVTAREVPQALEALQRQHEGSRCASERARSLAQATSSADGLIPVSSRALTRRPKRG